MDKKTINALKKSIAHWDRLATGTQGEGEDIFDRDCALCLLFHRNFCAGCPVRNHTGCSHCQGSPWHSAADADLLYGKDHPKFLRVARKMADFLRSLLPPEKGTKS